MDNGREKHIMIKLYKKKLSTKRRVAVISTQQLSVVFLFTYNYKGVFSILSKIRSLLRNIQCANTFIMESFCDAARRRNVRKKILLSQSYFISFYARTIEKNGLLCKSSHTDDNSRWMAASSRAKREKKERTRNILSSILWEVKGRVLYIPLARHRGLSKWSVEELCQHECEQVKVTRALNCTTTKGRHRANLSEWTSDGLWWYHGGWIRNGDRT